MKRVDDYLNHLYKGKRAPADLDLKAEMKSHILDSIIDLKAEGLSEDEAITTALQSFGDEQNLKNDLKEFRFDSKKKRAKLKLLLISSLVFGIGAICIGIFHTHQYNSHLTVTYWEDESLNHNLSLDGNQKYYQLIEPFSTKKPGATVELTNFSGNLKIFNEMNYILLDIKVLNKDKEVLIETTDLSKEHFFEVNIDEDICYLVIEKKSIS